MADDCLMCAAIHADPAPARWSICGECGKVYICPERPELGGTVRLATIAEIAQAARDPGFRRLRDMARADIRARSASLN